MLILYLLIAIRSRKKKSNFSFELTYVCTLSRTQFFSKKRKVPVNCWCSKAARTMFGQTDWQFYFQETFCSCMFVLHAYFYIYKEKDFSSKGLGGEEQAPDWINIFLNNQKKRDCARSTAIYEWYVVKIFLLVIIINVEGHGYSFWIFFVSNLYEEERMNLHYCRLILFMNPRYFLRERERNIFTKNMNNNAKVIFFCSFTVSKISLCLSF